MSSITLDFNRREFLATLGLGAASFALPPSSKKCGGSAKACILVVNVGGMSQIDSFDPKPDACSEVRGVLGTIDTKLAGIRFSELFANHARIADKLCLVRSVYSDALPIHELGLQLVQTGEVSTGSLPFLHVGCATHNLRQQGMPTRHILLPARLPRAAGNFLNGQDFELFPAEYQPLEAALIDEQYEPTLAGALNIGAESIRSRDSFGRTALGDNFLRARRLIEHGYSFVTLNVAETVHYDESWDAHGNCAVKSVESFRNLATNYDRACSALIQDLDDRGLLSETLVACITEFGRTPRLNSFGGRDHWTGCWSVYFAGGGAPSGLVIGSSDRHGAAPADCPVHASSIAPTISALLGYDYPIAKQHGNWRQAFDGRPIRQMF